MSQTPTNLPPASPEPASTGPWRLPPVQVAWWVIAISLAVIAVTLVLRPGSEILPPAFGQSVSSGAARGTYAFTGQLTKNTFGVFMVDVDAMTLWCYEYNPDTKRLRLAAGREWTYDRYLGKFNNADPLPDEVRTMVELERAAKRQSSEMENP